jgi:hypothetical protein
MKDISGALPFARFAPNRTLLVPHRAEVERRMSLVGQKRTWRRQIGMSALTSKAAAKITARRDSYARR